MCKSLRVGKRLATPTQQRQRRGTTNARNCKSAGRFGCRAVAVRTTAIENDEPFARLLTTPERRVGADAFAFGVHDWARAQRQLAAVLHFDDFRCPCKRGFWRIEKLLPVLHHLTGTAQRHIRDPDDVWRDHARKGSDVAVRERLRKRDFGG